MKPENLIKLCRHATHGTITPLLLAFGLSLAVLAAEAVTLTVTNTSDSGVGSLRQAIQDSAPEDTINFALTGTITLTNGQLLITNNLTIVGPGSTNLAVSGNNVSRVFEISSNITITMSGLTIANGRSTNGGGIYNAGSLVLLQCALVTNVAFGSDTFYFADAAGDGRGGGVYNIGSLNIRDTLFQKNVARGGGVGSPMGKPGGSGFGGAICNAGTLSVSASTFAGNAAQGSGGGLGANATYFSGAIGGGTGGAAFGGAIYTAGQNVGLTNSTFGGNTATGGNGGTGGNGLFGYCHTFPGNPPATRGADGGSGGGGYGGALYSSEGLIRIVSSTLSGNTAFAGSGGAGGPGGTCFEGDGSAPSGNSGYPGYAIGGGVNSTKSLFEKSSSECARPRAQQCGFTGRAQKVHAHRPANVAAPGDGRTPSGAGTAAKANFQTGSNTIAQSTIIADNRVTSLLSAFQSGPDVTGPVGSLGHNLIGVTNGSDGWVTGDLTGNIAAPLDAKLGSLQNNGGVTWTMALLSGSPAIDQGSSAGLTTDQRGRIRPIDNASITNAAGGDGSDIGAFELQSQPITITAAQSGSDIMISFLTEFGRNYRIERKDSLAAGAWTTVAESIIGSGARARVIDPGAANLPKRFYRAEILP